MQLERSIKQINVFVHDLDAVAYPQVLRAHISKPCIPQMVSSFILIHNNENEKTEEKNYFNSLEDSELFLV